MFSKYRRPFIQARARVCVAKLLRHSNWFGVAVVYLHLTISFSVKSPYFIFSPSASSTPSFEACLVVYSQCMVPLLYFLVVENFNHLCEQIVCDGVLQLL